MTSDVLVSAIIPTYNRAHMVCDAIDSVLRQTYRNIEPIVVDDGSTDDTQTRLKPYGDRIRVVAQANRGQAAARNRGIATARGEVIAFLDSDDLWLPTKIERQIALLQKAGDSVPCCLCNITMQWKSGDRASFDISWLRPAVGEGVWTNPDEVLATRFVLFNQAVAIRREVLERIGGFDETIRYLEDYELPLRLSLEGSWAFIAEPLVIWRESGMNSVSQNCIKEEICTCECMVDILERHLATVNRTSQPERLRSHVYRGLKNARRDLWVARTRQRGRLGSAVGASVRRIDRYRSALVRRSPWFPRMHVVPVESWTRNSVEHDSPSILHAQAVD